MQKIKTILLITVISLLVILYAMFFKAHIAEAVTLDFISPSLKQPIRTIEVSKPVVKEITSEEKITALEKRIAELEIRVRKLEK